MNFTELQTSLQNLTNKKIFLADFAKILNCGKANISNRAKNKSEVTVSELQKIEKHYNVSLYNTNQNPEPVLEPDFDLCVECELSQWGKRLLMLQIASKMFDSKDFAKFLDISENRIDDFIRKNKFPNCEELLKIKTRFSKTSLDWLLFGKLK